MLKAMKNDTMTRYLITQFTAQKSVNVNFAYKTGRELVGSVNKYMITVTDKNGDMLILEPGTCLFKSMFWQGIEPAQSEWLQCGFTMKHNPNGYNIRIINPKPIRWKWLKRLLGIRCIQDIQEYSVYARKDFSVLEVVWKLDSYIWTDAHERIIDSERAGD